MINKNEEEWALVSDYSERSYKCGAVAGDIFVLRESLPITQGDDFRVIEIIPKGSRAKVLLGSMDSPGVLWCRWIDSNKVFTWSDSEYFLEVFVKMP